jgi:hypothetical protein
MISALIMFAMVIWVVALSASMVTGLFAIAGPICGIISSKIYNYYGRDSIYAIFIINLCVLIVISAFFVKDIEQSIFNLIAFIFSIMGAGFLSEHIRK